MDDKQAFERDIAGLVQRAVRPSHPVDPMPIVRSAVDRTPRWGFQPVFNATKLAVAVAIVALAGGFLAFGLLPSPPDAPPAPAATGSPDVSATQDPLAGLVTETVEPGVLRVVADAEVMIQDEGISEMRDLQGDYTSVTVTPDGSVWVVDSGGGIFRLGQAGGHFVDEVEGHLLNTADGSAYLVLATGVWAVSQETPGYAVTSFGDGLRRVDPEQDRSLQRYASTAVSDGSLWVSYSGQADYENKRAETLVRRHRDGSWEALESDASLNAIRDLSTIAEVCALTETTDGVVWAGMCDPFGPGMGWGALAYFDGADWTEVHPFTDLGKAHLRISDVSDLAPGPGGSLWGVVTVVSDDWIAARRTLHSGDESAERELVGLRDADPLIGGVLVHFDGQRWSAFDLDDLIPDEDGAWTLGDLRPRTVVDEQDRLWLRSGAYLAVDDEGDWGTRPGARTLVSTDGEVAHTWDCVGAIHDLALDAQARIWVAGYDGLFVIDPSEAAGGCLAPQTAGS